MSKGKITKEQLSDSLLNLIKQSAGSGAVSANIEFKKNSVLVQSPVTEVAIGISGFNKDSDLLMVFKNTTYLEQEVSYTISSDSLYIQNKKGIWNESGTSLFNFIVIKGSGSGSTGSGTTDNIVNTNLYFSPNYIFNSSFGRFNSSLKPDYWNTNSIVSNSYSSNGNYSLYMKEGEYCYQESKIGTELLDASKWSKLYTRYSFRILGKGSLKISVWSGESKVNFKVGDSENYVDEYIYTINSDTWGESSNYITIDPNMNTLQLKFDCTSGYVYIDSIMGCPINNKSQVVVYQDGPMCKNDTMTIVDTDIVDAKIGDMWFVRKGDLI